MRRSRKDTFKSIRMKKKLKMLGLAVCIFICTIIMIYFMTAVTAETLIKPLALDKLEAGALASGELAPAGMQESGIPESNNREPGTQEHTVSNTDDKSSNTGFSTGSNTGFNTGSNTGKASLGANAGGKISLNVKNTDIRDVLSAIALGLDINIIFMEQPTRVTFKINNVTYLTALEYFLKSNGLGYTISDNIIIVGKSETLEKDFLNKQLIARFDLNYITAGQLSAKIDNLGIPVKQVVFNENEKMLWAQGTSQQLSKIKELVLMVDIPENMVKEPPSPGEDPEPEVVKLVPFKLEHIDANIFESFIKQLGMDIKSIIIENNPQTIWISARDEEIKQLEEIVSLLDIEENKALPEENMPLELIPYALEFVAAENINKIVEQMGIDVKVLYLASNPYKIWIDSKSKDIRDFEELIEKIDIMENGKWFLEVTTLKLKYLTADKFKSIVSQLDIPVQVITLDSNAYTVWVSGTPQDIVDVKSLLHDIDISTIREDSAFFIRKLKNISPQEAVTRFEYLQITDAKVFTLSFPLFSKEILIVCKPDRRYEIESAIDGIDVEGDKIRVPIDYSTHAAGQSRLAARRDLLVSLTGIPESNFYISGNISRDSTPRYIMWVEESPENIEKIMDMIEIIDSLNEQ
jgi:type II secretory pathway component GspD/PulD (secretin)